MKSASLQFLVASVTILLAACGGSSDSGPTTSRAQEATPQLAKTIQILCPNCVPTPTNTPSQLATTIKAINPKATPTETATPTQLQIAIENLRVK